MSSIFEKELEFVQLLCNPEYLRWLYNEGYFGRDDFIQYLRYLLYFKEQKYAKFLIYPQCIPVLELLVQDGISKDLSEDSFYTKLSETEFQIWKSRA